MAISPRAWSPHGLLIEPTEPTEPPEPVFTDTPTVDSDTKDIMRMLRIILARRVSKSAALSVAQEAIDSLPPVPGGSSFTQDGGGGGGRIDPEPFH